MQITRLRIKNFKCFENIELDIPANGFSLLIGENQENSALGANGCGKTSLFDAICWCLFEKTGRGLKASKLLNREIKATGYSVSVEFDHGAHTISRSWGPISRQLDGVEVDQETIDKFLRMNYDQWLIAVYFHQGGEHFIDLTPGEKLNFFADVFQLNKWSERSDKCKEKVRAAQAEALSVNNVIEVLLSHQEAAKRKYDTLIQQQTAWKVSVEDEKSKQRLQLSELKDQSARWKSQQEVDYANTEYEIKTLEAQVKEPPNIQHLKDELAKIDASIKSLNTHQLASFIGDLKIQHHQLIKRAQNLADDTTKLVQAGPTICGACNQAIPDDGSNEKRAQEYIDEIEKIQKIEIPAITTKEMETQELYNHAVAAEAQFKTEYATKEAEINNHAAAITIHQTLTTQIKSHKDRLQTILAASDPYEGQIALLEQRLVAEVKDPYDEQIQVELLEQTKSVEVIAERNKELAEHQKQIGIWDFWTRSFPEIRLEVLNEIIESLELYFNQAIANLGMDSWLIKVDTERALADGKRSRKELHITFHKGGQEIDLDTLSGGERQRVRIATAVGISDLVKSKLESPWNLLLLDEPSLGLSEHGIEDLLNYLKGLSASTHVFMADHRLTSESLFDSIVKVTKSPAGISTVASNRSTKELIHA